VRYAINKTKYLLEPEAVSLEASLEKFKERDIRNVLLLELALRTGARAKEVLNIQFSDLNEHEKTVFIRGLKHSNDREIPLRPEMFKRLYDFASKDPSGPIFKITYNHFRRIWCFYRPVRKKLHSLRHTFAIRLYKKTKDMRLVQMALGHRNIQNTMVYAEYVYSQTELRKLIL
jgi:integrase/recombinase XerC